MGDHSEQDHADPEHQEQKEPEDGSAHVDSVPDFPRRMMTPGHDDMTAGEMGRTLERIEAALGELRSEVRARHHTLANQLTDTIIPAVNRHSIQIENQQKSLDRLDGEVRTATTRSAFISGGIAALGFIAQFFPWPWRR